MAHELYKATDMMFLGDTPWHHLGIRIDDALSVEDALSRKDNPLNFEVTKEPVFLGNGTLVHDNYAIVRKDNGEALAVVGNHYVPMQYPECFRFMNNIVSSKEAIFHTIGALRGGRRGWILAKLPGEIRVVGDDITEKYLLISNSMDGSSKLTIQFTPIRVVCANTLRAALAGTGISYSIRHTINASVALQDATKALGISNQYYTDLQDAFQAMQRKEVNFGKAKAYIDAVFEAEAGSASKGSTRGQNILNGIYNLLESGKGAELPGVRGTMWGAYNAVTEYVDHVKKYRSEDSALENIAFGYVGGNLKQRAFDLALTM